MRANLTLSFALFLMGSLALAQAKSLDEIPILASKDSAKSMSLGTPVLSPKSAATTLRHSIGQDPDDPKKRAFFIVGDLGNLHYRSVDGAGSTWKILNGYQSALPTALGNTLLATTTVFGSGSFMTNGKHALLLSVVAYYKNSAAKPYDPMKTIHFILKRNEDRSTWSIAYDGAKSEGSNKIEPIYNFQMGPRGVIFGFTNASGLGTAETEAGGLARSDDSGRSFKSVSFGSGDGSTSEMGLPLAHFVAIPGTSQVWAATDNPCKDRGGISLSQDGGKTWVSMFNKIPTRMVRAMIYDKNTRVLTIAATHQGSSIHPTGGPAIFMVDLKTMTVRKTDLPFQLMKLSCPANSPGCDALISYDGYSFDFVKLRKSDWSPIVRKGLDLSSSVTIESLNGRLFAYELKVHANYPAKIEAIKIPLH